MQKVTKELLSLDTKDQKILAELFRDGRAHYSTIAKNTHISKDIVNYRISKLIESGVMTNVSTIIDVNKLGWSSAIVFFKIMNLDKTKIKQFVKYLVDSPFIVEILELAGRWDFIVRFYHKDNAHLNQQISELETRFPNLIDNHSIFFISENIPLPYNALFTEHAVKAKRSTYQLYKPDKLDLKILSKISFYGRTPLAKLQEELNENRMTIYNRINKMLKAGIIQSFRPNLFTEKLGFHWYIIDVKLNNRAQVKAIADKLKNILNVHWIMYGFGVADIAFDIQVKHVQELQSILYMIREQFSKDIKSVESSIVIQDYKWDFFPKGFLKQID
jgi:Lrp/AsnC family transcriptional regulator, leucine-responsive regulatory protein